MSTVINALIAACNSKACAPPPVGTGGSVGVGGSAEMSSVSLERFRSGAYRKLDDWSNEDKYNRELANGWSSYVNGNHDDINGYLRGDSEDYDEDVARMFQVFNLMGQSLPKAATLYRGVTGSKAFGVSSLEELKPGTVYRDGGYSSTSTKRVEATKFGSTMIVVHAPKGTRVLPGNPHENELIINKGTRFRVTHVDIEGKTVHVEVVP